MSKLIALNGNLIALRGNLVKLDARRPFIIEIDTTKGNGFNTFTLPLTNHTTDIDVKVSDGQQFNISNYLDINRTINFATSGVYTIELKGQGGWSFNNTGDCQKLTGIKNWGNFYFNYIENGFYGCTNIGLNGGLPTTGSINAPTITSINNMFRSCNLTSLYNSDMLARCENVTSAVATFFLNKIVVIPTGFMHHLTKLVNTSSMYSNNLINSLDIDLLDNCTELKNIIGMFQINLITFVPSIFRNISSIVDMTATFQNNLIASVADDLLHTLTNLRTLLATFESNRFERIKTGMFVNNVNVINYARVFNGHALEGACVIDGNIFDVDSLYKVVDWTGAFANNYYGGSLVGTIQDIWNYASITATKTNTFKSQRGLTNYNDIPNEWKGL